MRPRSSHHHVVASGCLRVVHSVQVFSASPCTQTLHTCAARAQPTRCQKMKSHLQLKAARSSCILLIQVSDTVDTPRFSTHIIRLSCASTWCRLRLPIGSLIGSSPASCLKHRTALCTIPAHVVTPFHSIKPPVHTCIQMRMLQTTLRVPGHQPPSTPSNPVCTSQHRTTTVFAQRLESLSHAQTRRAQKHVHNAKLMQRSPHCDAGKQHQHPEKDTDTPSVTNPARCYQCRKNGLDFSVLVCCSAAHSSFATKVQHLQGISPVS